MGYIQDKERLQEETGGGGRRAQGGDRGGKPTPSVGDVSAYGEEYGGITDMGVKEGVVLFLTYNICNGRNSSLSYFFLVVYQFNINLGVM